MDDKRASQNRRRRELYARKKELRRQELVVSGENQPVRKRKSRRLTGLASSDDTISIHIGEVTTDRTIDVSDEPIEGVEEIVESAGMESIHFPSVDVRMCQSIWFIFKVEQYDVLYVWNQLYFLTIYTKYTSSDHFVVHAFTAENERCATPECTEALAFMKNHRHRKIVHNHGFKFFDVQMVE
ncbi:Uncharacterized protein Fot_02532 [Forsythia ovata]|uniref:BZIP domain-containing protein n=1 Tax=Forsythia ovata TaxID=205694 RepID=A0ABD1XA70_9LAMI